jgi:DNA-binding NarL/FixJ family response regulator
MKKQLAAAAPLAPGRHPHGPGHRPDPFQAHAEGPAGHPRHQGVLRVLRWMAEGHAVPAIAQRLGRDPQRLAAKLQALLTQLQVSDAASALQQLQAGQPAQQAPAPVSPELQQALADDEFDAADPAAPTAETTDAPAAA